MGCYMKHLTCHQHSLPLPPQATTTSLLSQPEGEASPFTTSSYLTSLVTSSLSWLSWSLLILITLTWSSCLIKPKLGTIDAEVNPTLIVAHNAWPSCCYNNRRSQNLECWTMERPIELTQSSFSFSESTMKYMVSERVESSKAFGLLRMSSVPLIETRGNGDDAVWTRWAHDGGFLEPKKLALLEDEPAEG